MRIIKVSLVNAVNNAKVYQSLINDIPCYFGNVLESNSGFAGLDCCFLGIIYQIIDLFLFRGEFSVGWYGPYLVENPAGDPWGYRYWVAKTGTGSTLSVIVNSAGKNASIAAADTGEDADLTQRVR